MDDKQAISLLPLKRTWLDDIVEEFLRRPNGEGEVDAIVIGLLKSGREVGAEAESTVTRTINNFCINPGDTDVKARHPVFEHIGPAKYKLLTYPNPPDLIEIQNIQFSDRAYQKVWGLFSEKAKKNPNWESLSKRGRLVAFSRNVTQKKQWKNLLKLYGDEPPIEV